MTQPGQHTFHEILTQPDAWAEALQVSQPAASAALALQSKASAASFVFTGCGSTYYLSLAAAALAREKGLAAGAAPGSEVWLFTRAAVPHPESTLLVAVSRSGETTETIRAVGAFRRAGGQAVIVVTCYPDSALAALGDLTISLPLAQEKSVAQTRSFASMLVACQVLVATLVGEQNAAQRMATLPQLGRQLISAYGDLAARLGTDLTLQRFFFLGNGPCYGLACEAMLKMKEMSLSYSEAYHVLEFRHGPKSMVDDSSLVTCLQSEMALLEEQAVLADMQSLSGRTLSIAERGSGSLSNGRSYAVGLDSGLAAGDRQVLYLPVLQLLAYHRAIAKGLDPDGPRNLTAVVVLK